jgi:hypothetical protein
MTKTTEQIEEIDTNLMNKELFELTVGTILYVSWGYDQTNIDFYQIIRVLKKSVEIRPIGAKSEQTGFMSGKKMPSPGDFIGSKTLLKRSRSMDPGYLSDWNGRPTSYSWYG